MTDLERFVAQEGREDLIADVRRRIDAEGITYIYYQFVSVTGRIMGKGVPAPHWETIARKGFQLVYGSTANLFIDRRGDYIGYGPEARELIGLPDVDTFCPLPWDPRVARVFCTLFRGREEEVDGGAFLTSDCRGNLHRIHDAFTAATGLEMRIGCEPEMMWLKTDAEGKPTVEGMTKPYCYHIDQFSELQPIIHKVLEYAGKMGLDMIQGDHEDAPGQLELNFQFDKAERTADRLTTYRQICRQVGRELGAFPCFMPKPFMGVSANGCHHNFSLWRGEENTFLPDTDNPRLPGVTGLHAVAGVLEHLLCAVRDLVSDRELLPPLRRRRLLGSRLCRLGLPEPHDGAADQRARQVRVPVGRLRRQPVPVDGGPARDDQGRYRPEPRSGASPRSATSTRRSRRAKKCGGSRVPSARRSRRCRLTSSCKTALPGDMYRVFMHYKTDEWERFISTVSDWDIKEYLDVLP